MAEELQGCGGAGPGLEGRGHSEESFGLEFGKKKLRNEGDGMIVGRK